MASPPGFHLGNRGFDSPHEHHLLSFKKRTFVWLAQWPSIRLKPGLSKRLDEARRTARGTDSTQVLSYRPVADAVLGFDSMARHHLPRHVLRVYFTLAGAPNGKGPGC